MLHNKRFSKRVYNEGSYFKDNGIAPCRRHINRRFCSEREQGRLGVDPKNALIEGEITSIDLDKRILYVKRRDEPVFFCELTEFFQGDISLPIERVFHAVKFSNDQKINVADVSVEDLIKSRYSKFSDGKIYLDTCLVGKYLSSRDVAGSKDTTLLSEKWVLSITQNGRP
ncbi:hypothetical protein BIY37_12255 [Candidatus Brocadia sapporoensis]|uniref:Uncharacterized protein n=1 Tax=Candidatus Brocadia sapporoensis TaxID=392547 RepID=A0A1V6LX46_9BACT|nr:hypothetical protein [Candidatus Brocadia sapporoensis]MDG6004505.1 hypothetical protein [Candidatus Brocadia sp.]OQD44710.1 hypothetical protein BIY37_12255 [Candidatus Brocadia sapporoensis]